MELGSLVYGRVVAMSLDEVGRKVFEHALVGDREMIAAEMPWLDDGQLRRLIKIADLLRQYAREELISRIPR